MRLLYAIVLGLVQGLTEFIPVSSTAHMTLLGHLAGLIDPQHPEQWTAIMAVVQLGTLLAVLAYFAGDVRAIAGSMVREVLVEQRPLQQHSLLTRQGWLVIIGSIPIGVAGLLLRRVIEGTLTKDPAVIALMLAAVAIAMLAAERVRGVRTMEMLTVRDAVVIGIAQALALIPGASRSGVTIAAGLFLGIERSTAARFSFLLSIPAVLASGVLELTKALAVLPRQQLLELSIATLVAALSGYASIAFLLTYLRRHRLNVFAYYRLALAAAIGVLLWQGVLQ